MNLPDSLDFFTSFTVHTGVFATQLVPFAMVPKQLNFITGNKNKLAEVQAILSATPVKLQSQAVDLVEIQGTIEEISRDKARRAADHVSFTRSRMRCHLGGG